jgi:hypothetical protein
MKFFILSLIVITVIFISCDTSKQTDNEEEKEYITLLKASQKVIDSAINKIYSDIAEASKNILENNFDESNIRTALNLILSKNPSLAEAVYVNRDNIITYAEPATYKYAEGQDISQQEHQKKMIETKLPVMSSLFKVVENYYAVVLAIPILKDNEMVGSINLLLKPSEFIPFFTDKILKDPNNKNYKADDFNVAETNGTLLFDIDTTQIGRNLFTDSLYLPYKEMIDLCHYVMTADSGKSYYSYLDKTKQKNVVKDVWWRTSSYYGNLWKLSIIKERN